MNEYETLTELGKHYDVSCKKMGALLEELGLRRVGKKPTSLAFDLGLVKKTYTGHGDEDGYFYTWHAAKTINLLEKAGHQQSEIPTYQQPNEVKVPLLIGPFSNRLSGTNSYEILNGDGNVVYWTIGDENARIIVNLLNLAYNHG